MIATLVADRSDLGSEIPKIGTRLYFDHRGVVSSGFPDRSIQELTSACLSVMRSRLSNTLASTVGEVFIEYISARVKLLIFGAGADAVTLAQISKNIGWHTAVVDHRPAFLNSDRFPSVDELLLFRPEEAADVAEIDGNTAVVIMTHNYEHDRSIVSQVLFSNAFYIGMLGPKRRIKNIAIELADKHYGLDHQIGASVYSPIGLNIGADNPEMISISIIAEIQTVLKSRHGGFLKDHNGPINDRLPLREQPSLRTADLNMDQEDVVLAERS